jgi:hypothetical protein
MRRLLPVIAVLLVGMFGCDDAQSRKQSEENLRSISLGLLNYESFNRHLPPRAIFHPLRIPERQATLFELWGTTDGAE